MYGQGSQARGRAALVAAGGFGADGMKRNLKVEGRFFHLKPRGGDLTT